jgi:hypothetical protein
MKNKRHKKYLDFADQTKIRQDHIDKITDEATIAANLKKKKLNARKNPKSKLLLDLLIETDI